MRVISVSFALLAALAVAGCKDTNRPLQYNKGVYGGPADSKLPADKVETLRQRGLRVYD